MNDPSWSNGPSDEFTAARKASRSLPDGK